MVATPVDTVASPPAAPSLRAAAGSRPARRRPGWMIVARKEFADHLLSLRFFLLLVLVGLSAVGAVHAASGRLRDVAPAASDAPDVLLRLLTIVPEDLPSFASFFGLVGFLSPLLGIAFGFDAINGERSQGTLPRLVSQPIHRDDVINGKFAAGLALIALTICVLAALVVGVGIYRLGVTPDGEELLRLLIYLGVSIVYAGVWLALAVLASVVVRRASTSALLAIAAWLIFTVFSTMFAGLLADALADVPRDATFEQRLHNARMEQTISRFSPETLYEEASTALLLPEVRSLDILTQEDVDRAVAGELPLTQSLLVVWPQITALVALIVVLFAAAYIVFLRQEIRA